MRLSRILDRWQASIGLSFAVASRKQGAEEERTRGGYAVSLRFVSGLYRQKGHASFWTLGQWGIHLALLVSTYRPLPPLSLPSPPPMKLT